MKKLKIRIILSVTYVKEDEYYNLIIYIYIRDNNYSHFNCINIFIIMVFLIINV